MARPRIIRWVVIIVVLWLLLWAAPRLTHLFTDWLWFGEVGYRGIFWRGLSAKIYMGLIFGGFFFAVVYGNALLALRMAPRAAWYEYESQSRLQVAYEVEKFLERWLGRVALAVILLLAYGVAVNASRRWLAALVAFNSTPFGKADPVFDRDLSFYIFQLPLIEMAQNHVAGALTAAIILSAAIHYLGKAIRTVRGVPAFAPHVKVHLSILVAAWLLSKGWDYWLQALNLLYSERGVVFGASYTDVNARLFACYVLLAITILGALVVLANLRLRGLVLPLGAIAFLIVASILASIYPAAVQRFRVEPSEQTREAQYIARNIEATRFGFGLQEVRDLAFPPLKAYDSQNLEEERITIQNVRLWDHRPLREAYKRKQELHTYYHFENVDIDRYTINGEYRQVMLSPREIDLGSLPQSGWQNEHIKYTHGYGVVLSPVNEASRAGEPRLLVRDIPPVSDRLPQVTQPEIYFGEIANSQQYSLVRTTLPEIDYPIEGDITAKANYTGTGGVPIGPMLNRLALSMRFGHIDLIFSENITEETKIIFRRSIRERLNAIAPFLAYDYDPYMVISESGKLYWIQDAYTVSGRLPYSEPHRAFPGRAYGRINYIRNSVKIVIDPYSGTTSFFVADEEDPILKTLSKIFPGTFHPLEDLPENLRKHIRYPEELFHLQARVLSTYHMLEPDEFYSKSDKWQIAREAAGKQASLRDVYGGRPSVSEGESMQAYYAVMRLPGETKPEFILMIPFSPLRKDNMRAWMAARSDPDHYGELLTYEFSRAEQVFGPIQFEALIDSDTEMSKLFSWWGERGSQVVRGNLLVIPLGESILYVEPIFLKAETAAIPQLKLVVVGRQEGETLRVFFAPTLRRALAIAVGAAPRLTAEALEEGVEFAKPTPPEAAKPTPAEAAAAPRPPTAAKSAEELRVAAARAREHYRRAQQRLRAGDLTGFERELEKMEAVLEEMARE